MTREELINELQSAIAELEAGASSPDAFIAGHGIQSLNFRLEHEEPGLAIDFTLPCERVLSSEEAQKTDTLRIGAACRMALMLLAAARDGKLLAEGESKITVTADEDGYAYWIAGADGETIDSSDDWNALIARLGSSYDDVRESLRIIWP